MRVYYASTEVTGVTHVDFDLVVDGINGATVVLDDPSRVAKDTWKARINVLTVTTITFDDGTLAFSGYVVKVFSRPQSLTITLAGDLHVLTRGEITANYAVIKTTITDMYNSGGTNWVVSAQTVAGDAYIGYWMHFSDLTDTPTSASAWYAPASLVECKLYKNNIAQETSITQISGVGNMAVADDTCHVFYVDFNANVLDLPYQDHFYLQSIYEFDFSDEDQPVGLLELSMRAKGGEPAGAPTDAPANYLGSCSPMIDLEVAILNYNSGFYEPAGHCPVFSSAGYNYVNVTISPDKWTRYVNPATKKARVTVRAAGWYLPATTGVKFYGAVDYLKVKMLYTDAALFLNCPPILVADNTADEWTGEGNPDLAAAPYNVETGDGMEICPASHWVISGLHQVPDCPSIAQYLPPGMLTDIDNDNTSFGRYVIGKNPAVVLQTIARGANYHWFERVLGTGEKIFCYTNLAGFYDNSVTISDDDVDPTAGGVGLEYGEETYCEVIYLGQEKRFGAVASRVKAVHSHSGLTTQRVLTIDDAECGSTSEAQQYSQGYADFLADDDLSLEIPLADSAATRAVMPGEVVTISIYENSATKTIDLSGVPVWWKHCAQDAGGVLQQTIRVGRGDL